MSHEFSLQPTVRELQGQFGNHNVTFDLGEGRLQRVTLTHEGDRVELYMLGAHIVSWKTEGAGENLWMSEASNFQVGEAIRGGIPVCYPQFGDMGDHPRHGFARTSIFKPIETEISKSGTSITLQLDDGHGRLWDRCPNIYELKVQIGQGRLLMSPTIRNVGNDPIELTEVFHSYLRVEAIENVRVHNLKGVQYEARPLVSGEGTPVGTYKEEQDSVTITSEVDRIYHNIPGTVEISDPAGQRQIFVEQTNRPDGVLWNPHIEKSLQMADFEPKSGYRNMLCFETGNITQPITIQPGESHTSMQILRVQKT